MIVTLTSFKSLGRTANGDTVPVGKGAVDRLERTTDGDFAAIGAAVSVVRISASVPVRLTRNGLAEGLFEAPEYIDAQPGDVFGVVKVV